MGSTIGAGRTRAVLWGLFGVVLLIAIIDGASITLARLQVGDDAQAAARQGAQSILNQPINQETAEVAYAAAVEALPNDDERIIRNEGTPAEAFQVGDDGSVTLTVTREAPTLVVKYLPTLSDLTTVTSTYKQLKIGF